MHKYARFPLHGLIFALTLAASMALPLYADAHGIGTILISQEVNGKLVDVDYNDFSISAGIPTHFNFQLLENDTQEPIDFSSVWVRIDQDSRVVFSGYIGKSEFGPTGMTFAFPKKGEYHLLVDFYNDIESLAEATTTLSVDPSAGNSDSAPLRNFIIGIVLGLLGGFIYSKTARN